MAVSPEGLRVCVTGGAGFIGSHLTNRLVGINDVVVLDDLSNGDPVRLPEGVELVEGDIRDPDAVSRAVGGSDLVYHLAAQIDVDWSVEAPVESHSVNVDGSLEVLEAARRNDVRVVAASSAAIYGEVDQLPVKEGDAKEPSSPYGLEKLSLDHYVGMYHDLYGLPSVVLRPFNVYGPGQGCGQYAGVVSIFRRQASQGGPLTVEGDGTQTRDFVHVRDVVRALLLAAGTDETGEAFNIASGRGTSILELSEVFQVHAGRGVEVVHVEPRPGDIGESRADVSKAEELLGFEPEVSLEEGISSLLEDF